MVPRSPQPKRPAMPDPFLTSPQPLLAAVLLLAAAVLVLRRRRRPAPPPGLTEFGRLIGGRPARPPSGPGPAAGPCRWSRDAFRPAAAYHRWICTHCDAEVFLPAHQPPAGCRRPDRKLTQI